jgi:hypothetical protein
LALLSHRRDPLTAPTYSLILPRSGPGPGRIAGRLGRITRTDDLGAATGLALLAAALRMAPPSADLPESDRTLRTLTFSALPLRRLPWATAAVLIRAEPLVPVLTPPPAYRPSLYDLLAVLFVAAARFR